MQKKIELSKETLRELTMRPLTDEELKLAAGGLGPYHAPSDICNEPGSDEAASCVTCRLK